MECNRPDICTSGKLCLNTNTKECCHHADRRDPSIREIYIDEYGIIGNWDGVLNNNLICFPEHNIVIGIDSDIIRVKHINIPYDIYYCPSCRVTIKTSGEIISEIKSQLPTPSVWGNIIKKVKIAKQEKIDRIYAEQLKAAKKANKTAIKNATRLHEDKITYDYSKAVKPSIK